MGRTPSRKKSASVHRVRIAEGHELMETPSPIQNGPAGDDEGEDGQQVNKGNLLTSLLLLLLLLLSCCCC